MGTDVGSMCVVGRGMPDARRLIYQRQVVVEPPHLRASVGHKRCGLLRSACDTEA
jgi:hypothetical protein